MPKKSRTHRRPWRSHKRPFIPDVGDHGGPGMRIWRCSMRASCSSYNRYSLPCNKLRYFSFLLLFSRTIRGSFVNVLVTGEQHGNA